MWCDLSSVKPYVPLLTLQYVHSWKLVKSPEIDPNMYGWLFYTNDPK